MSNQKDAAVSVMQEFFPNGGRDFDEVCALFDAIVAGKVPGIVFTPGDSAREVEHG
ncbi:hypothetical protein [Serratia sp. Nf2]|uniref:hypothetical protein n=1 Tax=Serratia sp. Nf2 TaxID=2116540 RepID=UPI001304C12B|nr:hypothetical protein [Serratia sp. Nf2]